MCTNNVSFSTDCKSACKDSSRPKGAFGNGTAIRMQTNGRNVSGKPIIHMLKRDFGANGSRKAQYYRTEGVSDTQAARTV